MGKAEPAIVCRPEQEVGLSVAGKLRARIPVDPAQNLAVDQVACAKSCPAGVSLDGAGVDCSGPETSGKRSQFLSGLVGFAGDACGALQDILGLFGDADRLADHLNDVAGAGDLR